MHIDEAINYIEDNIPSETIKDMNSTKLRKLIRLVIKLYLIYVSDILKNGNTYTMRYIGKFIPSKRRIGHAINPLTGLKHNTEYINTFRFKLASTIKKVIN
jgi:nucleoid DNA-binding protein